MAKGACTVTPPMQERPSWAGRRGLCHGRDTVLFRRAPGKGRRQAIVEAPDPRRLQELHRSGAPLPGPTREQFCGSLRIGLQIGMARWSRQSYVSDSPVFPQIAERREAAQGSIVSSSGAPDTKVRPASPTLHVCTLLANVDQHV